MGRKESNQTKQNQLPRLLIVNWAVFVNCVRLLIEIWAGFVNCGRQLIKNWAGFVNY